MHKMDVAGMKTLRRMRDKIRKDKTRNKHFREDLGVASVQDKIKKAHLRWFEHVQHRLGTALVRKRLAM